MRRRARARRAPRATNRPRAAAPRPRARAGARRGALDAPRRARGPPLTGADARVLAHHAASQAEGERQETVQRAQLAIDAAIVGGPSERLSREQTLAAARRATGHEPYEEVLRWAHDAGDAWHGGGGAPTGAPVPEWLAEAQRISDGDSRALGARAADSSDRAVGAGWAVGLGAADAGSSRPGRASGSAGGASRSWGSGHELPVPLPSTHRVSRSASAAAPGRNGGRPVAEPEPTLGSMRLAGGAGGAHGAAAAAPSLPTPYRCRTSVGAHRASASACAAWDSSSRSAGAHAAAALCSPPAARSSGGVSGAVPQVDSPHTPSALGRSPGLSPRLSSLFGGGPGGAL